MERTLSDLEKLQEEINSKWADYKKAITAGEPFEKVKIIYMDIKSLQKEIIVLMDRANKLHSENNGA